jgi:hypothetical protein
MPNPQQRNETGCTYADYLTWNDDERWEVIGGEVYNMSPAPGRTHQTVSRRMAFEINALTGTLQTFHLDRIRLSASEQR